MKTCLTLPSLTVLALLCSVPGCASNDSGVQRCASIDDRDRRLACFDAMSDASGSAASAEPSGEAGDFGLEHRKRPRPESSQLTAKVVQTRRDPYGKLIITLDNGQVWKQTGDRKLYIKGDEPRASIRRGVLGSFSLKVEGTSTLIWVKRVK